MPKLDSIYASIFPKVSGILDFELMQTLPLRDEWDSTMEYLTMFGDHTKSPRERIKLAQKIIYRGLYPGVKLSLDGNYYRKTILWTPPGFSESEVVMSIIRFDEVADSVTSGVTPSRSSESWEEVKLWVMQNEKTLYVTLENRWSLLNTPFQYVGYETYFPMAIFDPTEKFEFSKIAKMRFPILRKFSDPLHWQAGGTDILPRYAPNIGTRPGVGFGIIHLGGDSYGTGTWREKDILSAIEFLVGKRGSKKYGVLLRRQINSARRHIYYNYPAKRWDKVTELKNITLTSITPRGKTADE